MKEKLTPVAIAMRVMLGGNITQVQLKQLAADYMRMVSINKKLNAINNEGDKK